MGFTNAFEALGLDREEATVQALRAGLAAVIRDWIRQSQLTQAQAGKQLGVPQSAVSAIVNGQTGNRSVEYFIRLLARIGVAWTARCWDAPSDAAAVKGPAPPSWIGTGNTTVARIPATGIGGPIVWGQTLRPVAIATGNTNVAVEGSDRG